MVLEEISRILVANTKNITELSKATAELSHEIKTLYIVIEAQQMQIDALIREK